MDNMIGVCQHGNRIDPPNRCDICAVVTKAAYIKDILKELGVFKLTPVECHNRIYYKRDDLYMPFKDLPLSGGKVRQAIMLMSENYKVIKELGGRVITPTSPNSPQGLIVARVAKEFGFGVTLVVGNTNLKSIESNPMLAKCLELGAEIDYESKMSYDVNLLHRIKDILVKKPYFLVKFGINLETSPKAMVESIAYQAKNLPEDLDVLVVPIGSAITFGGILKGLIQYGIKPRHIIGVQIAGYDRLDTIYKILSGSRWLSPIDFEFVRDKTYPYSKHLKKVYFNDHECMDPVYEAKAFKWMMKNVELEGRKVLFWIVGNSEFIRHKKSL